jgi:hypothetical protein
MLLWLNAVQNVGLNAFVLKTRQREKYVNVVVALNLRLPGPGQGSITLNIDRIITGKKWRRC